MEKTKYTDTYTPQFSECGENYDVKPQSVISWACETAGNHLASRGITRNMMWEDGQVFLLTGAAIHFDRVPVYGDKILLTTWESGTKGSRFIRSFALTDEKGERLGDISSAWILVNPHTHKLYRPSEYAYDMLLSDTPTTAAITKIRYADLLVTGSYTFVYSDIDANGHVNNGVYLRLACDVLGESFKNGHLRAITVSFVREAGQGDKITICTAESEDRIIVVGRFADESVCFEVAAEIMEKNS